MAWQKRPNPSAEDPIRFVSATDGWLAGGPGGDCLYATRDGGRPAQLSPALSERAQQSARLQSSNQQTL